jgi:hypothetical protein
MSSVKHNHGRQLGSNLYRALKNSFGRLVKKVQLRGAGKIDERRRTCAVRWSEAIERNKANEPFSTAWQDLIII